MSEILNLKHTLSDAALAHYISQEQIEASRDPCSAIATAAHILVSERHGKFDLVHLVAYLMQQNAATAARLSDCARALRLAENEMRYAGWFEPQSDNVGQEPAYAAVVAALATTDNKEQ